MHAPDLRDRDRSCSGCPLEPDRRQFLQFAGVVSLGALLGIGIPAVDAAALTPSLVHSLRRIGDTVTYPIPPKDGVQIDRDHEVILVRWQNAVYAFNLSCPHQNTALRWNEGDAQFQCPKHHSKYRPDGTFISGRATRAMDRLNITRAGDTVVVDVSAMHKDDVDHAGWDAAVVKL